MMRRICRHELFAQLSAFLSCHLCPALVVIDSYDMVHYTKGVGQRSQRGGASLIWINENKNVIAHETIKVCAIRS